MFKIYTVVLLFYILLLVLK